jgi:hypothetical protein
MAERELTPNEPQFANQYDDRGTAAVKSVMVEVAQILGAYRDKFTVVGGSVPWLLQPDHEMPHVGTIDLDLALDADALGDGEYAMLIAELLKHSYVQPAEARKFQLSRTIQLNDGGPAIDVIIDFLMPRGAEIEKNNPPLVKNFAVQRADGADLALRFSKSVTVEGLMPNGASNKVKLSVCSIPAFLAMKGYALAGRYKQKDAYDVYYCIAGFEGDIEELAKMCLPILQFESGAIGLNHVNDKFEKLDSFGPVCVRNFVSESEILAGRTPEQWQQDAFGQVDALMRALKLRG